MKSLNQFVMEADASTEPANNKVKQSIEKKAEHKVGKTPDNNGSHGTWAIDEPYEDGAVEPLSKDQLNINMKLLLAKIKSEEPFFIIGETGWGKTSIIKDLARRNKRAVITVYLDKALASYLSGIPVPVKGKNGNVESQMAMPQWAAYMNEHADKQFLLFFDDMNQVTPDVMNALRPIVLENVICGIKFKNFMVGAAGNFDYENGAVSELSGPLESLFKSIIVWKSSGNEEWKQAFRYMHKNWDDKLSASLIDKFEKNAYLFENPREVEHKILKFIYNIKQDDEREWFDAEDYEDRLLGLIEKDLKNHERDEITNLAEIMYDYVNNTPVRDKK